MMDGLSQLADGVGIADLSNRGRVVVVGPDAAKLLNNLCTNDILKLQEGEWCEAFFLNAKGGVLFYARVFKGPAGFSLDLEPGLSASVIKHIDRFIIREKVTLVDNTSKTFLFHVCGKQAAAAVEKASIIKALNVATMPKPNRHIFVELYDGHAAIACVNRSPYIGFDVEVEDDLTRAEFLASLRHHTADVRDLSSEDVERLRILAGLPAFGREIVEGCLAQEIDRNEQAISFTKGCYIGQETVARLDAMGHVNKIFRGLVLDGNERPTDGAKIVFNEKEVGSVSSSAVSLDGYSVKCLAIVRIAAATPGTQVTIDGRPAMVSALPFA